MFALELLLKSIFPFSKKKCYAIIVCKECFGIAHLE